ncbi:hypothetical protein Nos7524_3945 [Nostoc sp. PCC 7524]|uniref:hypothetical protein n=1 Tax=Nostoc sp. (strain ATCC 29411 / PCC 7524) TaxID=28072 RepID=UPI00029F243C|nr:hypothetical protein [Nostoc sp. PCC 7524]AFY49718.1 hypothetical protein Nos7524_3945 [Nostoc sp. PCC 7524]
MLIDNNQTSPDIIQAYLSYLQEMSRKISLRSGMENILYRKTKKNHPYYMPADSIDTRYLKQVKDHIDKEADRKLFLANGLVVGTVQKRKENKYIASPLIYFLVDIDIDESSRQLRTEIEWDSASLNYDLITLILERDLTELEIEIEDNHFMEQRNYFTDKAEVFEEIELDLENYIKQDNLLETLNVTYIAKGIFIKLQQEIEEFKQALISDEFFNKNKLDDYINNECLTFFNHQFFYIGSLPGQLSTFTALRKLIQEVK